MLAALLVVTSLANVVLSPRGLDADLEKLNEYIQADKLNEQSVEALYADLAHRFNVRCCLPPLHPPPRPSPRILQALKDEMAEMTLKAETSIKTEASLKADLEEANQQQRRLSNSLGECQKEVSQMAHARATALHALGLESNATSEGSL